jgi:AmiR/NasT family two-component response regulator
MTQQLRIVIADDEPDMREFLTRMLPRCGHLVVAAAENGAQLVELCRKEKPDLVITDIKMPVLDGIEASEQINRERPVPVILLSAYLDPKLVERAERDHVCAYLVKPVGAADLQPAIAAAIKRFEERRALSIEDADLRRQLKATDNPGTTDSA